jgi:hypothetical protein
MPEMQNNECLLATIPGSTTRDRLLVELAMNRASQSQIVLRQQSWAEGIGWYDQKSLAVTPAQLAQLKAVLGGRRFSERAATPGAAAILPFAHPARAESA